MAFVYKSDPVRGAVWARLFAERAPQVPFHIWPETGDPAAVRFLAAWIPPPDLARLFPNLEVLFSAAAGIDQFDLASLPPDLPIVRMIEPGIARGMVEYVCWAVLGLHRDMPAYLRDQRAEAEPHCACCPLPAGLRRRAGTGRAGCGARAIARLRFRLRGWSRSRHDVAGPRASRAGLSARTGILAALPPLTADTRDARCAMFTWQGACLSRSGAARNWSSRPARRAGCRPARRDTDVCDPEPLPPGHWLWQHQVQLTRIASMTQPESAVEVVENLRRFKAGEPWWGWWIAGAALIN
jgi:glyoxylate/hydroxypyruvate reductase A